MKLDVDVKIYEATTKNFKDYKLNYKHKSIVDLIEYLKSKRYRVIAFDTFSLKEDNSIHITIEKLKPYSKVIEQY